MKLARFVALSPSSLPQVVERDWDSLCELYIKKDNK